MKTTIKMCAVLAFTLPMMACSDEASKLKEQALQACETSVLQVPENVRERTLKMCQCTVEKTDYQAVLSGDTSKIQAESIENAQACAKEVGVM